MSRVEIEWIVEDGRERERRRRRMGSVRCPRCRCEVPLEAETNVWTQREDGRWGHSEYGPALGFCCGLVIADDFNGCFAYELRDE